MIVEVYAAPAASEPTADESPISSTTGELPDEEPTLSPDDLLGSFDSPEDAIDFVTKHLSDQQQTVTNTQRQPFSQYTHVELLTASTQQGEQRFYLVTDEGY